MRRQRPGVAGSFRLIRQPAAAAFRVVVAILVAVMVAVTGVLWGYSRATNYLRYSGTQANNNDQINHRRFRKNARTIMGFSNLFEH
jgi:hypothetical protein